MWTVTWLVSWGAGTLLATAPAAPGFTSNWSNVLLEVEEPAVEEHFLDCGSVVAVRIVRDPVTGVGRGFGYVLFEVWKTDVCHCPLKCTWRARHHCSSFRHTCHCHLQALP